MPIGICGLFGDCVLLGALTVFIVSNPGKHHLANFRRKQTAPCGELASDLLEGKCSVCDEDGGAIRRWHRLP